jgi:membrane protease YdiL (CAAX protease family)
MKTMLAPRRILLNLLTVLVVMVAGLSLLNSWFQAPPQTQLDLIQTHLSLQAARTLDDPEYQGLARPLLGADVVENAAKRYAKTTESLTTRLDRIEQLQPTPSGETSTNPPTPRIQGVYRLQVEVDALRLRTGLLAAYQQDVAQALSYWTAISTELAPTADVLEGMWGDPLRILPDAEPILRSSLDGWFRGVALQRLYSLQQRSDALNALNQEQEQRAIAALTRLLLVGGIPVLGLLIGIITLIGWVGWHLWRKQPLVGSRWQVPWPAVSIQVVLTGWFVGFFGLGWLVPQLYVGLLGIPAGQLSPLQRALQLLLTYLSSAAVGLGLIIWVARTERRPISPQEMASSGDPAPETTRDLDLETDQAWNGDEGSDSQAPVKPSLKTWPETSIAGLDLFRVRVWGSWPLWSLGAYFAAMPMVLVAGALSQVLLPTGGGGNPLLPLLLQSQGWGPRFIFFLVVSICAPIFEEILFRGFLLPSLSQRMPMMGAVLVSAVLFAAAHLSLSDLLPLTALGLVLGVIYSRTRNLLAPIVLHSLWNTGSLVALIVLGQAV